MKFTRVCMVLFILSALAFANAAKRGDQNSADVVYQAKKDIAQHVASLLTDNAFQGALEQTLADQEKVSMGELLADYQSRLGEASEKAAQIQAIDLNVRRWKGTEHLSAGLMQIRLYRPKGDQSKLDPTNMLVAFEPRGEDSEWTEIEAIDAAGNIHVLDAKVSPDFPLFIVDINGREDLRSGIALANEMLVAAGMQKPVTQEDMEQARGKACTGVNTAKMTYIRLDDDQEPWVKGAAEIYAFVSGIDPSIADPEIRVVDMPYLDHDGTNYYPNQLVVYWYQYRYNTVNITFYEHDDGTNYQEILTAVISGVRTILGVFAPEYAIIAEVANAILQAMPGSWFTDDDDYVDTVYTIDEDEITSSKTYNGAGGNVTLTLAPYCLN